MDTAIEKRAAIAARAAAQAVREGRAFTLGPLDPLPTVSDGASSEPEARAVRRDDEKAFLSNLDGIASGRVSVVR